MCALVTGVQTCALPILSRHAPDITVRRRATKASPIFLQFAPPAGADDAPLRRQVKEHDSLRSEEHTSELQSLMRISSAVFCLKQKHITIIFHSTLKRTPLTYIH